MSRLTVAQEQSLESTEEVLALLVGAETRLRQAEQAEEFRQRCLADLRVRIGLARKAVMAVTSYPYQREQEERVTA